MTEYYMGNALDMTNWPANAPRPADTPPEGVMLTETREGKTKRILYRALNGKTLDEVVISETGASPRVVNQPAPIPIPLRPSSGPAMGVAQGPYAKPFDNPPVPMAVPMAPGRRERELTLGQAPAAPAPPAPVDECPVSIEMPDGRVLGPDDPITVKDMCEILSNFAQQTGLSEAVARQLAPGQQVPVVGQVPGMPAAVPGQNLFGPAGPTGGGGGAFIGGGGGGPGPAGPQGAIGTPGAGLFVDFTVKTDGDFTAGPGAFVPVPGTLIGFSTAIDGPAIFSVQAVLGSPPAGSSQSGQLGLRIDGVDYPLTARLLHTFVGGVGEFLIGQSVLFPLTLSSGAHTVELLLRGLVAGEFGGVGLGTPVSVSANPTIPLAVIVQHR